MKRRIPISEQPQPTEAQTQKAILDWLAAERVWHERRNTGAMTGSYKGKSRFVRFSRPGTADIQAITNWKRKIQLSPECGYLEIFITNVFWIEVKGMKGVQSAEQKQFQSEVEAAGHHYILARRLEDVSENINLWKQH